MIHSKAIKLLKEKIVNIQSQPKPQDLINIEILEAIEAYEIDAITHELEVMLTVKRLGDLFKLEAE